MAENVHAAGSRPMKKPKSFQPESVLSKPARLHEVLLSTNIHIDRLRKYLRVACGIPALFCHYGQADARHQDCHSYSNRHCSVQSWKPLVHAH